MQWHLDFCGQRMQHTYYTYHVLSKVLAAFPNLKSIVEIGTGNGALSIALGLWGVKLGIPVLTIDHGMRNIDAIKIFRALNVTFLRVDAFDPDTIESLKSFINREPCLFICDGGDKPRELNLWAPLLPSGSVIAAHDWGTETFEKDVPNELLTPLFPEEWMAEDTRMAWWTVK